MLFFVVFICILTEQVLSGENLMIKGLDVGGASFKNACLGIKWLFLFLPVTFILKNIAQ
jgi:hypothetical protein